MKHVALTAAILTTLTAVCGCAGPKGPDMEFPAEGTIQAPTRVAEIQRAQGARNDGNLYAVHFTDDAVNSLGRAKLDAMMRDDETVRPLTIHLAPADSTVTMRRIESVTAYLKDNGVTESQMRFETGLSGESYHPSAPELANLHKTETGDETGAAAAAAPAPSASYGNGGQSSSTMTK